MRQNFAFRIRQLTHFPHNLGWVKSSIAQMLSADEKKTQYRSNAATFLVSYLLGCPIQDIDLNPNRYRTAITSLIRILSIYCLTASFTLQSSSTHEVPLS